MGDSGPYPRIVRSPHIYLILVAAGLTGVALYLTFWVDGRPIAKTWTSRLAVSIIGAVLTIVVVDNRIRAREKAETRRRRNLALHSIHGTINGHLGFLIKWYVAANEEEDVEIPESYEELFNQDFVQTVKHLDFSKEPSGIAGPDDWFEATGAHMGQFQSDIEDCLERYGAFLDSDILQSLLQVSDNPLVNPLTNLVRMEGDSNLLNGDNMDYALNVHLSALMDLVSQYDSPEMPNIEPIDEKSDWEQTTPGSGRIDSPIEDTDTYFGVKNLEKDRFSI